MVTSNQKRCSTRHVNRGQTEKTNWLIRSSERRRPPYHGEPRSAGGGDMHLTRRQRSRGKDRATVNGPAGVRDHIRRVVKKTNANPATSKLLIGFCSFTQKIWSSLLFLADDGWPASGRFQQSCCAAPEEARGDLSTQFKRTYDTLSSNCTDVQRLLQHRAHVKLKTRAVNCK